jgi:hypothetical protein
LSYFVQNGKEIFLEAEKIFAQRPGSAKTFKFVGVTVAGLAPFKEQLSLFDGEGRARKLVTSLDEINNKYGDFTITHAPAWQARNIIRDSVGFGRMKEFKVKFKPGK